MSTRQITSSVFVGRQQELERFQALLEPDSQTQILQIHTQGDGGIGKTQLLLRMQAICRRTLEKIVYNRELIDFYHTESRSRVGVMLQIADRLGGAYFPEFEHYVRHYQHTLDVSARKASLPKLEESFKREYRHFAETMREQGRVIILFFDTYEIIQHIEAKTPSPRLLSDMYEQPADNQGETSTFSFWLETRLFPAITDNTRLVVSGRYPLYDIDRHAFVIEDLNLSRFSLADTRGFWKHCFDVETDDELAARLGAEEFIPTFYALSDGRPVLLALFADWVNYDRKPLSPRELLREIERRTGAIHPPLTKAQKDLFEKALIERVTSLITPEDHAITSMAVAYRRMTPDIFHHITDIPMDTCRDILLHKLKPLSFIKYKQGDCILLHDEMRRLVLQHWWPEHDPLREIRRDIAASLVTYYENTLLAGQHLFPTEHETYTSELLEYAFLATPMDGLERFRTEFDTAMEDGKYSYADLLLREAESYQRDNPQDIPFPEYLRIHLRLIRYYTFTDRDYERGLRMAEETLSTYQDHSVWQESDLRGHFLLVLGFAQSALERFEEAIASFHQAKNVFYDLGKDYWLYRTNNSIGYAYYKQGKFAEAERYLTQSINGFSKLLAERREIPKRERRQLFQGLQLSLGNLASVYGYTGQFEKAIRYAEIVMDIVRNLPYNNQEIARARTIVGHQHAVAGHAIDAQYNLTQAEALLANIRNRTLTGRAKTDLGLLLYRVDEFSYLIEYYRAEEVENMLKGYMQHEQIEQAERLLHNAIQILSESPAIDKELADAYYVLGELYMITPAPNHWQHAEQAFLKSLEWGRSSKFCYGVVDTLESLVTLYYFWNGASGISAAQKTRNLQKSLEYQQELQCYDESIYPNLFGKYHVTLGDIEFDAAFERLRSGGEAGCDEAIQALKKSFSHYVTATRLMRQFNEERYYLSLRVFYNRLHGLIDKIFDQHISLQMLARIQEIKSVWTRNTQELEALSQHITVQGSVPHWFHYTKTAEIEEIYQYIQLRIRPQEKLEQIQRLQTHLKDVLNIGNFGLTSLLNSCLIGAYTTLKLAEPDNEVYQEQYIVQLYMQSGYYRTLGDEYQAALCLWTCRREIERLSDPILKKALEGSVDCSEGTLLYRRGEYGRLLEFYLQDELEVARNRFDHRYPGARERAVLLLRESEDKLQQALASWQDKLSNSSDPQKRARLQGYVQRYRKSLGETRFRISELLMLNEEFHDVEEHKGAFSYLHEALLDTRAGGDTYRCDNVVQSSVNALYFSGKYDDPDYKEMRQSFEKQLEDRLTSKDPDTVIYPTILGRLRFIQGDALFSRCFTRRKTPDGQYTYIPREQAASIRSLRTMLRYYVEACNFMAQHSTKNFASAVRVVQRRIHLISDRHAIQVLLRGFVDVWTGQEYLKDKKDEMETLIQFANIRSIMLENEGEEE